MVIPIKNHFWGYPRKRGYVAVENQEVVAYAALYKGNEAAYNDIYDGKWEHDNYLYISFHRIAVAKEAAVEE